MHFKRMLAAAGLSVIMAATGGGVATPAHASTTTTASQTSEATVKWQPVPEAEYISKESSLAALNGYVFFSNAGYKIDAPSDLWDKIPADAAVLLKDYIASTNADVAAGKLTILANGTARFEDAEAPVTTQWSGPHGSVTPTWYGWRIYVDGYLANKIIGGTWTAAGIAAALGVSATIAAAIGASAGVMQLCQASGGSLTYYYIGTFPTGLFGCNPLS